MQCLHLNHHFPLLHRKLLSAANRHLTLPHAACHAALSEELSSPTDPPPPIKKQRNKKASNDQDPSPSESDDPIVISAAAPKRGGALVTPKRGRPKKEKVLPKTSPLLSQPLPLGTKVLPQAAAAVYSLIVEHEMTSLRELLVARNISHQSLLKHLDVLTSYGLIDESLVADMHLLKPSNKEGEKERAGLSREQIKEVAKRKPVKAFEALSSAFPDQVAAQELKYEGITLLQIEYIKSLAKREAKLSKIAFELSNQDEDRQLTLTLLKKADLVRVQAYLDGKGLDEIRLPPYSRASKREGGVSNLVVLHSLVEAAKAGVQLPMERVLQDFLLSPGESEGPESQEGRLNVTEVCDAVGSCLHLRSSGLSGIIFYEAARSLLLRNASTRSKVEDQEELMSQDLTLQQIRICYYLGMAGVFKTGSEWAMAEA